MDKLLEANEQMINLLKAQQAVKDEIIANQKEQIEMLQLHKRASDTYRKLAEGVLNPGLISQIDKDAIEEARGWYADDKMLPPKAFAPGGVTEKLFNEMMK